MKSVAIISAIVLVTLYLLFTSGAGPFGSSKSGRVFPNERESVAPPSTTATQPATREVPLVELSPSDRRILPASKSGRVFDAKDSNILYGDDTPTTSQSDSPKAAKPKFRMMGGSKSGPVDFEDANILLQPATAPAMDD